MQFEITFDYLCPFARNAHEAVVAGLADGRPWDVRFRPFSLTQVHVSDDEPDVFDDPDRSGIRALHWGLAVRDHAPEHFPEAHLALFAARHDHGLDIKDEGVIRSALVAAGVDVDRIAEIVGSGEPAATLATEHTEAVEKWRVFGVPTFIHDDVATFMRLMNRGDVSDLEHGLTLLGHHGLNEFKRTVVPR